MQFKTLTVAFFAAAVAADSVSDLVSQIPSCAKTCLDNASTAIGCSTTDTSCQCSKFDDLTKEGITCVSTSCTTDDLTKTTKLSAQICAAVAENAGGAAASSIVSSAGAAVTSAINSITGTGATPTATPATGNRAAAGLGFAAAMAALAL